MSTRTFVVGVGLTAFEKPGARDWDYPDMAREAGERALADAGLAYGEVEEAYVGYCYGDSTAGQRALYELGLTGIPAVNVNNNCATGSTALYLARRAVQHGMSDCTLALGFEKMARGGLGIAYHDRAFPLERHAQQMIGRFGLADAPFPVQLFAHAAREYLERYAYPEDTFAKVAVKNHGHSLGNPYAQLRTSTTLEEVEAAPPIFGGLRRAECCPTSDGGAAVIIASERFVAARGLWDRAIEIAGLAMTSDRADTFDGSSISLVGAHMSRAAALAAYEESGLGPEDAQVIELHDCFAPNEVLTYEALGLCAAGQGGALIHDEATTYGGRWVVNPSGGLLSKGHPLGATGLAQCAELTWQLRGTADGRQVHGARVAVQHNAGLGGAAIVGVYRAPGASQRAG